MILGGQVGSGILVTFIDTQLCSYVTISGMLLINLTGSQCSSDALYYRLVYTFLTTWQTATAYCT